MDRALGVHHQAIADGIEGPKYQQITRALFGQFTSPTAGTGTEWRQKIGTADGSWVINATSYLNFTKNYHDSVSLVFLGSSGKKGIPKAQLTAFVGKKIHVGGILEDRNGALQMRVFDLEQIKVLP